MASISPWYHQNCPVTPATQPSSDGFCSICRAFSIPQQKNPRTHLEELQVKLHHPLRILFFLSEASRFLPVMRRMLDLSSLHYETTAVSLQNWRVSDPHYRRVSVLQMTEVVCGCGTNPSSSGNKVSKTGTE